jgi:hypothetical protein
MSRPSSRIRRPDERIGSSAFRIPAGNADPTQNRCVRQRDASIRHHDHQVPQTQFETRVPTDTEDDDLPIEMTSLEQCFDRNEPLHSAIIPDRGLFAPEPNTGSFCCLLAGKAGNQISRIGITMPDLNSLMIFAQVVEANSFSEAARRLKMPTSTPALTEFAIRLRAAGSRNTTVPASYQRFGTWAARILISSQACLFNEDYSIMRAALIPHAVAMQRASFVEHQTAIGSCDDIWNAPGVRDVTMELRAVKF